MLGLETWVFRLWRLYYYTLSIPARVRGKSKSETIEVVMSSADRSIWKSVCTSLTCMDLTKSFKNYHNVLRKLSPICDPCHHASPQLNLESELAVCHQAYHMHDHHQRQLYIANLLKGSNVNNVCNIIYVRFTDWSKLNHSWPVKPADMVVGFINICIKPKITVTDKR